MNKVDVSELKGPLTELMDQVGGENGRNRFEEFKLWLKNVKAKVCSLMIDLSVPCRLPFDDAERVSLVKSGVVKLERRGNDLHLDGKKINLFISERHKTVASRGTQQGHDLKDELWIRGGNIGASVLDHLVEYPELWPESWKRNGDGNIMFVCFFDDLFRHPSCGLAVRCGYWYEGRVVPSHKWLDNHWPGNWPSASVAS